MVSGTCRPFTRALRRVPGIVVGTLTPTRTQVTALGSVPDEPDPAGLCWEIGSITKVFTGLLLADMSRHSAVSLDDPIGRHLPEEVTARLPAPELQPTLAHLATHTSGLPRLPLAIYRRVRDGDDPYSGLTEQEVFACLGPTTRRPRHPAMRYSNFGMGLLGHLLSRAAGRPYAELVTERLLSPLGMKATGIGDCGEGSAPVAGYRHGRPTPPWTFGALQGAGALRSTVADLLTFARACIDPPTDSLADVLALARQPFHRGRLPSAAMGLGWMLRTRHRRGPAGVAWHNGGTYGASSFVAVDPARGIAVVAVGNAGPRLIPPLDRPAWAVFESLSE